MITLKDFILRSLDMDTYICVYTRCYENLSISLDYDGVVIDLLINENTYNALLLSKVVCTDSSFRKTKGILDIYVVKE